LKNQINGPQWDKEAIYNLLFANGKARYLLKKKNTLIFEKQTYYKMVEHRQDQRDYSAYFKMAD